MKFGETDARSVPLREKLSQLFRPLRNIRRFHALGSLALVLVTISVISGSISDRSDFADSELHKDVSERWGAPIAQAAPSVRFVPSGSVFTALQALPLESQTLNVDAEMSYRKRGLVLFSGFDFKFSGKYAIRNPQKFDIDVVFVFPIELNKNKVQLADLLFTVDGNPARIDLGEAADKLVWTGRVPAGRGVSFEIGFRGRGLDSFVYKLDPALPVRNLQFAMQVRGGDNYDYPQGIVPAQSAKIDRDRISFLWNYPSLESGLSLGATLPSEKPFDDIIITMVRRCWAPFLLFFAAVTLLSLHYDRRLRIYEAYLVSAAYAFFFVLLPYLAAFMPFYVAYALSLSVICAVICLYLRCVVAKETVPIVAGLVGGAIFIPTLAVILRGYTGLIYTLEILAGLIVLMGLTLMASFRELLERALLRDAEGTPT